MYRHIYTKSWYYFYTFGFIFSGKRIYIILPKWIGISLNIVHCNKINKRIHKAKKLYLCQRWKKKKTKCWLVAERKKYIINETFVPMDWGVLFILGCEVAPHKKRILNREKGDSDNLNVSLKSLCNSLSWIHCVNWRKQLLFSAFFVWIISKPFNFKSILQKCHRWLQVKKNLCTMLFKSKDSKCIHYRTCSFSAIYYLFQPIRH